MDRHGHATHIDDKDFHTTSTDIDTHPSYSPTSASASADSDTETLDQPDSLELSRIETHRLQQKTTVGSTRGPQPRETWLPMGAGKEYPPLLPDPEDFVVEFDGAGDPLHPYNWSLMRRYASSMAET